MTLFFYCFAAVSFYIAAKLAKSRRKKMQTAASLTVLSSAASLALAMWRSGLTTELVLMVFIIAFAVLKLAITPANMNHSL
ncbi:MULTISPECIES: hypothetical protein [unclassified Pseudoalteromonas]|uniref:hypothetical protein n=1 Tax=unclassified Pseudoalteromonas TaxID=194690 RepID=UPI0030148008